MVQWNKVQKSIKKTKIIVEDPYIL